MYEDLQQIVQLEFGKEMEAVSQEVQANIQEAQTRFAATQGAVIRSGHHEATLGRIRIAGTERLIRALYGLWVNIIVERNGQVSRPDIEFIVGRLGALSDAQSQNLLRVFAQQHGGVSATLSQEAQRRIQAAVARSRRDLEIMVRRNEVLPKKTVEEQATVVNLNIQNSNIANLNLGSQVGTINAALEAISSGGSKEFAQALKEFTEAVVAQQGFDDANKREVVEALTAVAEQAPKKREERSTGTLKAIMGYIPTAISSAAQLTELWGKVGPTIKGYLGI